MKTLCVCVIVAAATVLAACGSPEPDTESYTAVASAVPVRITTVTLTAPAPQSAATDTAPPVANTAARVPMPSVVCMNLQAAQDLIQTAGVFYSRSEDATGRGRAQVVDRNWVVVSQQPAPGTPIGEGDAVLSVVKVGEPTDCW
ncbi:PASTA domain-containing protein [Nocardia sienata]|uniref:PASTA domain-containing protein n=1 Tax=Nocardia sienata TaxID=248552 RepID=UPI000AF41C31|nr:PASTA domain-containing protein [Nocardia sienata]